jgi:hypothetical protein
VSRNLAALPHIFKKYISIITQLCTVRTYYAFLYGSVYMLMSIAELLCLYFGLHCEITFFSVFAHFVYSLLATHYFALFLTVYCVCVR